MVRRFNVNLTSGGLDVSDGEICKSQVSAAAGHRGCTLLSADLPSGGGKCRESTLSATTGREWRKPLPYPLKATFCLRPCGA